MKERGFEVDHSTVQRWVVSYSPQLENAFHRKGKWTYFYRAVDKQGNTVDFLLTAKRDKKAALRFLTKAIGRNGKPGLINIDKSGANTAAIQGYNDDHDKRIKIRQCKYLNNIAEQDSRHVNRLCRAMLGFKSFHAAQKTLAAIELIYMIKKGQMRATRGGRLSPAAQFYALAA